MSDKLSVQNKEDIPQIIKAIVKIHGSGIISDIQNELLNTFKHDYLIDIIRNNVHEENKERQEFFFIGLDVYKYKYDNECSMKTARAKISEKVGIKDSTIRTHLENFRKKIKEDIVKLDDYENYSKDIDGVRKFIDDFIKVLAFKNYDGNMNKREMKEAYNHFMESINEFVFTGIPF